MLRVAFGASLRRFFASDRKVVLCANGSIAAWHPAHEHPYEHTKPIESENSKETLGSSRLSAAAKQSAIPRAPVNAELKDIFYTTKHEWYTRSREERLRHVAAPTPRRK